MIDFTLAFWATLAEMAPWLIGGFLLAGVLSMFFKAAWIERHLGDGRRGAVAKASILGVPLPLCSCGVIPVAASLYRRGAGKGATSSFLLSTPQTGVDSIFATYALMGPVFAVVRPIVALVNGLLAGWVIQAFERRAGSGESGAAGVAADAGLPVLGGACCESESAAEVTAGGDCCGDEGGGGCGDGSGGGSKWGKAVRFGLVTLPADIAGSLLIGLVIAALLTALVPAESLAPYLGGGLLAMLAAVVVGAPLYVCATGSIPIGLGLLAAGASPGAVLAFLIAGPATNAATVSVTWDLLGRRTGVIYLGSVLVTAIGAGLLLDAVFPTAGALRLPEAALHPHEMALRWWDHVAAVAMVALLLPALVKRFAPARRSGAEAEQAEGSGDKVAGSATLSVMGMTCGGCASAVQRALTGVPGVTRAEVDHRSGRATVQGASLDRSRLEAAVRGLGYRVGPAEEG